MNYMLLIFKIGLCICNYYDDYFLENKFNFLPQLAFHLLNPFVVFI